MSDVTFFWRNARFHDATLLLSSDPLLLEQERLALSDKLDGSKQPAKKRKHTTASKPSTGAAAVSKITCIQGGSESDAPAASSANSASQTATSGSQVLQIPVHRIVLSTGSDYFNIAISTLIGDSAASDGGDADRLSHPIIVMHEQDVESAQGVLQFLYTKTVDSQFSTAPQLMHLLLVSNNDWHHTRLMSVL